MRPITILTGLTALLVAGCAAFFSVTGLGLLFSGATMAVIIMAGALEFGKLVAASYLHNYWDQTNKFMRTYLVIGVVALVLITSAGIFGFLSNAYTQTQISVAQVESKVSLYEGQRERALADIPRWESRITTLSENRTRQEVRYDSLVAGENWVNARRTTDLINEADAEIGSLSAQIDRARATADSLDQLIFETRQENVDVEREIGGFRFVAQAFDKDVDTVVKWFIFLLIFVFDPFAVTMVLAFNNALAVDRKTKQDRLNLYEERETITGPQREFTKEESDAYNEFVDSFYEYDEDDPFGPVTITADDLVVLPTRGKETRDEKPTHYNVKTAGGRVIIKAKHYDPEKHEDAKPLYHHGEEETI